MTEQIQACHSGKKGLLGDLDTLAVRMESTGMTEEVAASWAKTVREAIQHIENQSKTVHVDADKLEHLLNCLDNQKFLHEQKPTIQEAWQAIIDKANREMRDILLEQTR